jgi:hypothetical protein
MGYSVVISILDAFFDILFFSVPFSVINSLSYLELNLTTVKNKEKKNKKKKKFTLKLGVTSRTVTTDFIYFIIIIIKCQNRYQNTNCISDRSGFKEVVMDLLDRVFFFSFASNSAMLYNNRKMGY